MLIEVSDATAVALSSVAWFGVSLAVGWWGAGWPARQIASTGPVTTIRGWEDHGRWWQRHLRVRAWKDRVPEAGGLFGGFAKRKVPSRATEHLELFRRETIRAERVHWLILASTPLHLLWCDAAVFAGMAAFGVAFTVPFIVIQRSNRGRLDRLIERRGAVPRPRPATRSLRRPDPHAPRAAG